MTRATGPGRAGALVEGLGEIAALDQIGQAAEELADANARAVEVGDPLGEDGGGDHAAEEDEPHERPAFLHIVQHRGEVIGQSGAGCKGGEGGWRRVSPSRYLPENRVVQNSG